MENRMSTFRALPTNSINEIDTFTSPDQAADITPDSPAMSVFTDFHLHSPQVISSTTGITEAEAFMKKTHVKLKLVVDGEDHFLGALSYADLSGEKYRLLIGAGISRDDINVRQVMTPISELKAIYFDALESAKVGDIVETLKADHSLHFLVVDSSEHKIRGIFSASDLARSLHVAVDISTAPTFAQICHVMFNDT